MPEKIISKYTLKVILENDKEPLAIADKNYNILWFNKNFKKHTQADKLKGKNFLNLFQLEKNFTSLNKKEFVLTPLTSGKNLNITALKSANKLDGYLLKLSDIKNTTKKVSEIEDLQNELQNTLTFLAKEKPINNITEEILKKSLSITGSIFSVILFIEEKKKYTFHYYDPETFIENKPEVNRDLKDNLNYIQRWLTLNKKPLLIENKKSNIGFQLIEIFNCKYIAVIPCFFEEKLLASVIVGKNKNHYSGKETNILELFASLLAFSIVRIRSQELNLALENKLLQAQKLETIGKLSSGMAHDFNNLLSSIFGSLNLLRKRAPQNENITRLIDNIENCSIRARDLTKGLLSFGKPSPKRKELIKPNLLLKEIVKIISQTFPKKIALNHNIHENLLDILGNPTEIYQVLLNLCVNAKEAMDEKGGILSLKAFNITVSDKNIINYPLLNKGNYIVFTVKDNGSGINEDNLQKIFDPYFSTKQKDTGSGLGLYVSYGIIKAHNGHIEVTSKINGGTQFDVFLPSYEPTKIEKISTSEKLILLADDEIMLRDLLAELLESNGYTVIRVISGTEALRVLTEEIKVDLIILDYNMPEMNGLDCVTEIRKFNKEIPVILSSGSFGLNGQNVDMKEYGINSFVNKPYEFDTMLATIQELI